MKKRRLLDSVFISRLIIRSFLFTTGMGADNSINRNDRTSDNTHKLWN